MTEEMNGGCCGGGNKKVSKDALAVAGAILFGSLVIAMTMFVISPKTTKVAVPTDAAKQQTGEEKPEVTLDKVQALFDGQNISFGKKDSKVLFVEFSDPSCPFCHVAAGKNSALNNQIGAQFKLVKDGGAYVAPVPEMKKLVDTGKASYVWLYANGHGNGELGTRALYCGNEKGKFWEVHDLLMSAAGYEILNTTVKNDVKKAGVMADFLKSAVKPSDMQACLESGKYDSRLESDMEVAKSFGFSGTPSFFVNTKNFSGAYSFTDMQSTVDQFLK
jgi:protein-disulfide isomerase